MIKKSIFLISKQNCFQNKYTNRKNCLDLLYKDWVWVIEPILFL